MELENKEFKLTIYPKTDVLPNSIEIMDRRCPWKTFLIAKNQFDALIDILNQLKEEIDGK